MEKLNDYAQLLSLMPKYKKTKKLNEVASSRRINHTYKIINLQLKSDDIYWKSDQTDQLEQNEQLKNKSGGAQQSIEVIFDDWSDW